MKLNKNYTVVFNLLKQYLDIPYQIKKVTTDLFDLKTTKTLLETIKKWSA